MTFIKRKNNRYKVSGYVTHICDNRGAYDGIIREVSDDGLSLTQVPIQFNSNVMTCVAVISDDQLTIKVKLRPVWSEHAADELYQDVGFKIINSPWGWTEFVSKNSPRDRLGRYFGKYMGNGKRKS